MSNTHSYRCALELIAQHGCSRLIGGRCWEHNQWAKDAEFTAYKWCDACIAQDALNGSEPEHGEPFAWAIFSADTHEMTDLTPVKPGEEKGYYAEPLYRRPATGG